MRRSVEDEKEERTMRHVSGWFYAALAVLFFSTCTSPGSARKEAPPDWVLSPPQGDDRYEYFVGYAVDPSSRVKAEDAATQALISEIMRFMGVRITAETTGEAQASLEEFSVALGRTVKEEGSARVSGFKVVDRYWYEDENGITVYILARYERDALLEEKARLEALFKEAEEAISGPERRGERLLMEGRYAEAAVAFLDAARAAASSSLENREVRFQRNLDKAVRALQPLEIEVLRDNLTTYVGEAFPAEFQGRVVREGEGVVGATLLISYRETTSAGRTRVRTVPVVTGDGGEFSFSLPVMQVPGSGEITVRLDLSSALELLEDLPGTFREAADAVKKVVLSKQAVFHYRVESRSKTVPTGVLILDLDSSGGLLKERGTERGLMRLLSQEGFSLKGIPEGVETLSKQGEEAFVSWARARGDIARVIVGNARIDEFSEDGDGVMVRVSGYVKVVDLVTGRVIATVEAFKRARGRSAEVALAAAFASLGEVLGEKVLASLP